MKKFLLMALATLSLGAHAQEFTYDVLGKWFIPFVKIGFYQTLAKEPGRTPAFDGCMKNVDDNYHIPKMKNKILKESLSSQDLAALENFLAQPSELIVFEQTYHQFNQLIAEQKTQEAQKVWDEYISQLGTRVSLPAMLGLRHLRDIFQSPEILIVDEREMEHWMLSDPTCVDYLKPNQYKLTCLNSSNRTDCVEYLKPNQHKIK